MFFISVILGIIAAAILKNIFYLIVISILFAIILKKFFNYKYFYIFPLILIAVFLNYKNRDYDLNDFDGNIVGKVISSKSNESVIRTKYINGKKFKTNILFYENLPLGKKYKISGKFKSPLVSMNEGNFNSNLNLKSRGIYSIGTSNDIREIKSKNIVANIPKLYINNASNNFEKYLNARNARLLKSIILGDRTALFDYQTERFKDLGISHLLAVSGLHIGVLVLFLSVILLKITGRKRLTDLLSFIIIITYIYAIGFPISVLRAFLFLVLYKMNFYFKINFRPKDVFFISLGIILFLNPMAIYSLSLILSYGSIFGIIFIYPKIKSYFVSENKLVDAFVLTFSVLLILLPILILTFGEVSLLVFLANILIVPIYSLVITLGFIMSFGILPRIIGALTDFILNGVYGFESLILPLKFLSIKSIGINYTLICLYYFALFLFFYKDRVKLLIYKNNKIIFVYICTILFTAGVTFVEDYNTYFERHIYVGQGDATLISYKGKNYLVDTGGSRFENNIAEKYLFPVLNQNAVKRLDAIFISHFDKDHAGNLEKIIKNYEVDNILFSYLPEDREDLELLKRVGENTNLNILNKNDTLNLNKDLALEVLSDNKDINNIESNDKSLVFTVIYKDIKILFTGDISKNVEHNIKRDIDILKVAHHGSRTSTGEEFLLNTTPKVAIISSGVGNSFGHPHIEVTERLKEHGIKTYSTKDSGEIILSINKNGKVNIKSFLDKRKIDMMSLSVIILKSVILYILAKENYELQKNLLR